MIQVTVADNDRDLIYTVKIVSPFRLLHGFSPLRIG